jgi:adenylylsulfate kinase
VSPTNEIRNLAREIIGNDDFIEIFLNPSLAACEQRDVKGMYKQARAGHINDFTGVNAPFEMPAHPFLEIHTDTEDVETSVQTILDNILPVLLLENRNV